MTNGKFSRILMIPMALVMAVTLVATAACTPGQAELLKGVLQNVNSANGTVTIVTNDGRTLNVTLNGNTAIVTQSGNVTLDNLEPGASVEIDVEKGKQVATHIESHQAEVSGNITGIVGGNVTVTERNKSQVTIQVTNSTRVILGEDHTGTLADLHAGMTVEAVYDPTTKLALRVTETGIENENENTDSEPSKSGSGILEIHVTDPGPANVKSAVVYLSNMEVYMAGNDATDNTSGNSTSSDNSSDSSSGWIPVIGAPASFDLMNVLGIEQILGSANITAGKYTQIRMEVTRVTGVTTDNISYSAEVPSDKLKIVGEFNVVSGNTTTLTLDFDGSKSLIQTGQGKFLFKPVVKLLVNSWGKTSREQSNNTQNGQSDEKGNSSNNTGNSDVKGNSGSSDNRTAR